MEVGFDTIGNATLICYDKTPVLVTDPWITGSAYFGSWTRTHQIPDEQMEAIKNCEYVWVSHGHPDHLSIESLRLLKGKKILLPDHVGGRIAGDLRRLGFDVSVLKDRVWTRLSPRITVLCIADYNQDGILLVDLDGSLLVDTNDTQPRGWGPFVRKTVSKYKDSFLLQLFGYGAADMINYFDENDIRIEPRAALKLPVGRTIADVAATYGVRYVIPFSSLQKYQRSDSVWANQYCTPLSAYQVGFESNHCELLPAFLRYDCSRKSFEEINPPENADAVLDPSEFGDDWSDHLEKDDIPKLSSYFHQISYLERMIDFVNLRVGGEDNVIELRKRNFEKGVVFEVPRRSLMRAVRFEIFDDLLIGNFMRTKLIGEWPKTKLYPDFTPYVAKYADNGHAKSPEELKKYFQEYRQRDPLGYLRHRIQSAFASVGRTRIDDRSQEYRLAQKLWWFINKRVGL